MKVQVNTKDGSNGESPKSGVKILKAKTKRKRRRIEREKEKAK